MLRVTVDTNVIISALNFPGNSARILEMAENGTILLSVSDDILSEVERVLLRPQFGWTQEQIDSAILDLSGFTEHVRPTQRIAFQATPCPHCRRPYRAFTAHHTPLYPVRKAACYSKRSAYLGNLTGRP